MYDAIPMGNYTHKKKIVNGRIIMQSENRAEYYKPKKLPTPFDSGLIYTVIAILYVYVAKLVGALNFPQEINLLLSQILFFVVPPILLARARGYDIKKTFRLKAPRLTEAALMLVMSPVMVIAGISAGYIGLLSVKGIFGRVYLDNSINSLAGNTLLVTLLLMAVLPAICEEFLFRGMIQRGMEKLGMGWSIFLSGILFGLFHFDFQRLAAQALIGFLSAYVVYRTDSIFNGMILHFMNNGLLLLISHSITSTQPPSNYSQVNVTDPFDLPEFTQLAQDYGISLQEIIGISVAIFAVVLVVALVVIFGLLLVLRAITPKHSQDTGSLKGKKVGILMGLPGLLLIAVVYTTLGMKLLENPLGQSILRFMGIY